MQLENKHILLTGASRGIGLALARGLAQRKAHLHLVSRQLPAGVETELFGLGAASVTLRPADLTQMKAVDELLATLKREGLAIDVLINNAGQLTGGLIEEQDPDDIEKMLAVNVSAVIRLSRGLLPSMLERRSGKIVNNASVSGKMFFPCASTYAASKAAVVAFTESIKQELRGTGVTTLLMITPGVKTEMYDDIAKLYSSHLDVSFLSSIPAQEWCERVIRALEKDQDIVWPSGASRMGVWLGHHFPGVLEALVRPKFKR